MSDPRTPRTVVVRLPGPPEIGDPYGIRWTEPGVTSPGEVEVRADCISIAADGSAVVELDGDRRTVPAARWSMGGKLPRQVQRTALQAVQAMAQASGPKTRMLARLIAAIIDGDGIVDRLTDVVQAAQGKNATDDDRMMAILAVGIAWASEVSG